MTTQTFASFLTPVAPCSIVWREEYTPMFGKDYPVLSAECVKHGWRKASHDHGSVSDAARDHVALVVGHYA